MKSTGNNMCNFRCKGCNKLLAKGDFEGKLEIVCPRCDSFNSFYSVPVVIHTLIPIMQYGINEVDGSFTGGIQQFSTDESGFNHLTNQSQ